MFQSQAFEGRPSWWLNLGGGEASRALRDPVSAQGHSLPWHPLLTPLHSLELESQAPEVSVLGPKGTWLGT